MDHDVNHDDDYTVITNLALTFGYPTSFGTISREKWRRIPKDLCLHTSEEAAWLHVEQSNEKNITARDLVVTDIKVAEQNPGTDTDDLWESRSAGIWVRRSKYTGDNARTVTDIDVLFGVDAVIPRPQWSLVRPPLQLNARPDVPAAQISMRRGTAKSNPENPLPKLRVKKDGKFKVLQVSDTHMVTGVGVCDDAMDADGQPLPQSEADPLTVNFLGGVLDVEKPDLVVLTGDQLHHDILDTQSALFKVVAPLIERSIPYAAVFGNHDDEGRYALSREAQMSLLQNLPFNLSQPGPEEADGVGNYYLQVFAQAPSRVPLLTLFFLDSHGQIPSEVKDPDYDCIAQNQIDWFTSTSQELRKAREKNGDGEHNPLHLSLAFMHISLCEYADSDLILKGGHRGEPTEGPSFNSHFYDALAREGIAAVGCGHDHVNDFCAIRPQNDGSDMPEPGPWLCHGGGSGFGGYGSYDGKRYYRRMRVWEFNTTSGGLKTWKRVEYARERIDELVLMEGGNVSAVVASFNGVQD
ncbi:Metallo-dependent phosphatase-like protein [Hypoxylon sp. FL1150]|nr:Metallo-dependent phosphatase-like protein [Hypoxylon sp. FL1150]